MFRYLVGPKAFIFPEPFSTSLCFVWVSSEDSGETVLHRVARLFIANIM